MLPLVILGISVVTELCIYLNVRNISWNGFNVWFFSIWNLSFIMPQKWFHKKTVICIFSLLYLVYSVSNMFQTIKIQFVCLFFSIKTLYKECQIYWKRTLKEHLNYWQRTISGKSIFNKWQCMTFKSQYFVTWELGKFYEISYFC